jgi:hypothetical protein
MYNAGETLNFGIPYMKHCGIWRNSAEFHQTSPSEVPRNSAEFNATSRAGFGRTEVKDSDGIPLTSETKDYDKILEGNEHILSLSEKTTCCLSSSNLK